MTSSEDDTAAAKRPRFTALGVWRGVVDIAPMTAFVFPFGVAFGVAASAKALPPAIAVLMSAAVFAGASQFAALDLWIAPLPLAMLAVTVLAVNARHILLGAALAPWLLQLPIARRLLTLLFLTDSNFAYAVSARGRGERDAGILLGSGLALWIAWIAGTAVGSYGGASLGDLSRFGLDALMVTYFAAVIVGQWSGSADLIPPGWHIIAGALAGGITGAWRHGA
jgi:4-azaleucine resistance transporter AzlC